MEKFTYCLELFFVLLNLELILGNSTIDCKNDENPGCLLCKPIGCVKCRTLIVYPTRQCVTECPSGYTKRWTTHVDYMGEICLHSGYLGGLSGESTAVLVGICTGALICVILLTLGAFYIRYKRQRHPQVPSEAPSDLDDTPERREFLKQVEVLRPHAPTFLAMLNDTRRQIRELHGAGDNAAITAYRPVVRDLAKILLIVNRPVDRLSVMPDDWDHLCAWGEKTLKRYKRMSEVSQPQVAQLVSFLQAPPAQTSEHETSATYTRTMSTFKPDQQFGSQLSLQNIAVKNFNSNYDSNFSVLNPQWNFNYSLVSPNPVSATPAGFGGTWQDTRNFLNSSYLLEDDFFQFGFRPQDEITTEL